MFEGFDLKRGYLGLRMVRNFLRFWERLVKGWGIRLSFYFSFIRIFLERVVWDFGFFIC